MTPWSGPSASATPLRRLRLWIDRHPAISALALGCLLAMALSALPGAPRACPRGHEPPGALAGHVACRPAAPPRQG